MVHITCCSYRKGTVDSDGLPSVIHKFFVLNWAYEMMGYICT